LKQLAIGGLVTDGSVRDTEEIIKYGFPCFSYSTTARQGPAAMQPWECNGVVSVSGVTVRPGDAIVGDQDGVVVVPAKVAEKVYNIAHGREVIEGIVKEELVKNPGPPGKFYPFMSGKIKEQPVMYHRMSSMAHKATIVIWIKEILRYVPFLSYLCNCEPKQ
jgi:hypothetical protein